MLNKNFVLTVFLIICLVSNIAAQDKHLLVKNQTLKEGKEVIGVKWISNDILYKEGVNLYKRKSVNEKWQLLNKSPIKTTIFNEEQIKEDESLEFFNALLENPSEEFLKVEVIKFQLLSKIILDNDFASHAGVYFQDDQVIKGQNYQYKVTKIIGASEEEIAVSTLIKHASEVAGPPIKELEVLQEKKKVIMNWIPEENRFFGVNIYKQQEDSTVYKMNDNPILISLVEDSVGNLSYPKPMFKENRLKTGKKYVYWVAGVDFFGGELQRAGPIVVDFKDVTPPVAPTEFSGKADSMLVNLKWEYIGEEFINGFNVYRSINSDGPFEKINASTVPVKPDDYRHDYQDSLTIPGPYYYQVTSLDQAGNEGKSFPIFVDVQDVIPPAVPLGFTVESDTGVMKLSWKANLEPDLGGYYIYRTAGQGKATHYTLLNATPWEEVNYIDSLPANVKSSFFYYLIAVDTSYNKSKQTLPLSAQMPDILAPEKPFLKGAKHAENYIEIDWISNVDEDLAGYNLFRKNAEDSTSNFIKVNQVKLGNTSFRFQDRSIKDEQVVYYYLEAYDLSGNISKPSNELKVTIKKKKTTNAELSLDIKYSKRKKTIKLSWDVTEENQLVGYVVYKGIKEPLKKPLTGLLKTNEFTDQEMNGQPSFYQVRAYYQNGQVVLSNVKSL